MTPRFTSSYERRSEEALVTALEYVPAYESWKTRDPGPEVPLDDRYGSFPLLTKADLREHTWKGFVPAGKNPEAALASGEISLVETSGTTEEKVVNAWHQQWWDWSEMSSWSYNAHARLIEYGKEPEAILTSPNNTGPLSDDRDLTLDERILGRFLYLNERSNPVLWTDGHMKRMLGELSTFRPSTIEANPSYLARLSRYAFERGVKPYEPKLIVLTYENPTPLYRKLIRLAFDAPMASSFGSTEAGYVFTECEHGTLHQNSESCRIDFEPLKSFGPEGRVGRMAVTTFGNPWRVLVRFDTGDIVRLASARECACGRNHGYTADAVMGRTANLTFDTEGRPLATRDVEDAISDVAGLAAYRLTQSGRREYEVEVEPMSGADKPAILDDVRSRLVLLYGASSRVVVSEVARLWPEKSGKYRQTRTLFPYDENSFLAQRTPTV